MLRDPYTSAMMPATATTTTTILQAENNNIVDGNLTTLVVSHATPIIHQPKGSDRWVVLYRVAHKKNVPNFAMLYCSTIEFRQKEITLLKSNHS